MAAFTLSTLKQDIQDWVENTSWGDNNQIETAIVLAEEKINSTVGISSYNTDTASSVFVAGANSTTAIADSITGPISPSYLKIRSQSGTEADNPWRFLLLKDYNFLQEYAPVNNTASRSEPKYYSYYNDVDNSNQITVNFAPYSDATYSYEFGYFFEPASITAGGDSGTTWLSTHGKNALFYGSLVEAYIFMKGDPNLMQTYELKFKEALQALVVMQGGTFRDNSFNDSDNAPSFTAAQ